MRNRASNIQKRTFIRFTRSAVPQLGYTTPVDLGVVRSPVNPEMLRNIGTTEEDNVQS